MGKGSRGRQRTNKRSAVATKGVHTSLKIKSLKCDSNIVVKNSWSSVTNVHPPGGGGLGDTSSLKSYFLGSSRRRRRAKGSDRSQQQSSSSDTIAGDILSSKPSIDRNHPFQRKFCHPTNRPNTSTTRFHNRTTPINIENEQPRPGLRDTSGQERIDFRNEQASLYRREMAKRGTNNLQQEKQRIFTWATAEGIGESSDMTTRNDRKNMIHLQPASFCLKDSEKTTSQLIEETVEEMNQIGLFQDNKKVPLRYDICRAKTRSLDDMLSMDDDLNNDMRTNDAVLSTPTRAKRNSHTNNEEKKRLVSSWSSASDQFQRQRFFQLQQKDESSSGSSLLPPCPLERSSRNSFNPFASLSGRGDDDDDGDDNILDDGLDWSDHLDSATDNNNMLFAFQPPSFDVTSRAVGSSNSFPSSNSSLNHPRGNSGNTTTILEEDDEYDDDL